MFLLHIIMHLYKDIAMLAQLKISLKQTSTGCNKTEVKLSHDVWYDNELHM